MQGCRWWCRCARAEVKELGVRQGIWTVVVGESVASERECRAEIRTISYRWSGCELGGDIEGRGGGFDDGREEEFSRMGEAVDFVMKQPACEEAWEEYLTELKVVHPMGDIDSEKPFVEVQLQVHIDPNCKCMYDNRQ